MVGFDEEALLDAGFDAVAVAVAVVVFAVVVFGALDAVDVVVLAAVLLELADTPELALAAAGEGVYDTAGVDLVTVGLVLLAGFDTDEFLLVLPVDFEAVLDEVDELFDDELLDVDLGADFDADVLELLAFDDDDDFDADFTAILNPP